MPMSAGSTTVNDTNHAVSPCSALTFVPISVSTFDNTTNAAPYSSPAVKPPET